MDGETARFETEKVAYFTHQVGENTGLMRELFVVVAVHEDVFAATVAVQIQVEYDFPFFLESPNQTFRCKVFRVQMLAGIFPPSVKILASQTAPVVSVDNTIRILHWNYFEHEAVSKDLRFRGRAYEEVYYTFHHPRRVALAWVDSGRDKNTFLRERFFRLWIFVFTCDCDVLASVAGKRPSQGLPVEEVGGKREFFDLIEIIAKVGVRVRERMSEVHLVIVGQKRMRE